MSKEIIYVDMDGVLVNYEQPSGIEHEKGAFLNMKPVDGAIDAFKKLAHSNFYDLYILSTAPWDCTEAWSEKRLWVEKYLGKYAHKRLILSHNKHLNKGEYLIDDRLKNGAEKFTGKLIHFGQPMYPNWDTVLKLLLGDNEYKYGDAVKHLSNNITFYVQKVKGDKVLISSSNDTNDSYYVEYWVQANEIQKDV